MSTQERGKDWKVVDLNATRVPEQTSTVPVLKDQLLKQNF